MTPRSPLTWIAAALAIVALPALGQTAAPQTASPATSATETFAVPPHHCVAPPYPTKESTMQLRGDAYNRAIEAFNRDAKTYGECMKKYVDDTKAWLKQVADAGNKAIDEYNKYNTDIREKIEAEKQ
jgi:hypothetical protein